MGRALALVRFRKDLCPPKNQVADNPTYFCDVPNILLGVSLECSKWWGQVMGQETLNTKHFFQ